ncbi:sugar transferase [Mycetocola zhadangensis]|uniref:sugar transferase n=1 Tax=Mycetocola zhadangensis TaxID=1164595 RepID=UPI00160022F3|nr:sugar transferase [Mycetocola zhadangensis]
MKPPPSSVAPAPPGPGSAALQPRAALRVLTQPLKLRWPVRYLLATTATDAIAILAALALAQLVRFGPDSIDDASRASLEYVGLAAGIAAVWLLTLSATRSRARRLVGVGFAEYSRVTNATLLTFGLLAIIAFLFQLEIARGYLGIALPTGLVLLLVGRKFWRGQLTRLRRSGRCLTGALVVGSMTDVREVVSQLRANLTAGYRPIGVVMTDATASVFEGLPTLDLDDLAETSKSSRTRAVMVAGNLPGGSEQLRKIGWSLESSSTELILVSSLTDVAGPRIHMRPVEGLPMVHVQLPKYTGFTYSVKRLLDVVVAGLGLVLFAPLAGLIALAVFLEDGGPVLFRQRRIGVSGSSFTMLKFRSMVPDAEARRAAVSALDEGNGVLFKVHDDPRITRVGAVIRRFSLDELPQLINVLTGAMSLIGPRPPLPSEVERYEDTAARRLLIKPGITGLWQVSGRSDLSWEESVKLDLYYVENWSVTGDFMILLRTVRAVLRRKGAY